MVFYKFSQLAGRVVPSTPATTYYPQGVNPAPVEATSFKFDSASTRRVPVAAATTAEAAAANVAPPGAPKGIIPSSSGYRNIVELQKQFAIEDGLMVWQKRGLRDKIPLWITFGAMGAGMCLMFNTLYKMSYPAKPESKRELPRDH